ncbi:hypothetical protein V9K67_09525 [Paraflavisolibacter sp. H34]|uniref:hypothetical protein n=1 Tax=Huijunlia imazamoxiresistens TaxID=3127457 RepID=UPI00301A0641
MRSVLNLVLCLGILFLMASCAATYKKINPSSLSYPVIEKSNFSYKYNVLKAAGNRKLAKKEVKRNMQIVAVQLINNTGRPLKYQQNFRIYSGSSEVTLLDPATAAASIKQSVPSYLLYLLLTPLRLNISTETKSSSTPIGLVIGPAIAAGNMAVAATANKRFRQELIDHSLLEREIQVGETFRGLIAIYDNGFLPLTVKISQ